MQSLQKQVLKKQDSSGVQGHLNIMQEKFENCKSEIAENEAEIQRMMD